MHDGINRTVGICDSCRDVRRVFEFDEYSDKVSLKSKTPAQASMIEIDGKNK